MHWIAPLRTDVSSPSMRYLYDAAPSRRSGESITSGLSLHLGRKRTPRPGSASRRQLQIVQARLKQSTRIDQLLLSARSPAQLSKTLDAMLDQTAAADQFRLAWSVFGRTLSTPSISMAEQTIVLDRIADRFANETAGKYAKLRRDAIGQSVEWQRVDAGLSMNGLAMNGLAMNGLAMKPSFADAPAARTIAVSPFQIESSMETNPNTDAESFSGLGQIRQVSAIAPLLVPKPDLLDDPSQAVAPENGSVDLAWEFHPLVLLGLESLGRNQPVNLQPLSQASGHPWSALVRETGRQTLHANRAARPPHLDGILDDDCWRS
jgi:hypothetical protein